MISRTSDNQSWPDGVAIELEEVTPEIDWDVITAALRVLVERNGTAKVHRIYRGAVLALYSRGELDIVVEGPDSILVRKAA
jgi:hypothetical protein